MKAALLYKNEKKLRIEDVPVPEINDDEVLIKVKAAGICHTELHFIDNVLNAGKYPIIPGHEVAGIVYKKGKNVKDLDLNDKVLLYYYRGCGKCDFCINGQENLCTNPEMEYGFINDGGFSEYIKARETDLVKLNDDIDIYSIAPIACSISTGIHALNMAKPELNDRVLVYGVGGVGFGLIQLNKLRGCRVFSASRNDKKLDIAKKLGSDYNINTCNENIVNKVKSMGGVDIIYDLVGSNETIKNDIEMLNKAGKLVLIGYDGSNVNINPLDLIINEIKIISCVGNTRYELEEAVRLFNENRIKIVIDRFDELKNINNDLEIIRNGEAMGRIVIKFD
ncbi:alcohol dehydrogenase catalytic domain-containing protein [Picrophilus oshimae]|uniref:Zinc-binding dehydrogenase n=1 Tax=Picrophilus torridus (strain ATCC 700027 / DSM 9790 / JCM 10055 / NBRC 100828 / KAW 2/3) TaxID=1122961 RepID=Q6L110_PICTO|nr:alcohol dehydrogenase catalytic domain-containing protein [Picrophilus oshimae]AAT43342.1 zinc-binding dehydrogenase [Picrophilus oshimae DSM 9789]